MEKVKYTTPEIEITRFQMQRAIMDGLQDGFDGDKESFSNYESETDADDFMDF